MQISVDWLREFVEVPPLSELAEKLQAAGVEVEAISDPASSISGVVVGQVVECEPHPKADRLNLCKVTDGTETFDVVCGAPNVAQGQRVPFAKVGADLGGFKIGERKLRGALSQGMICAREELQLPPGGDGIWVLPEDAELGIDIFTAMNIGPTLTLGITPNRPDLLCHMGVAREIAAATQQRPKAPHWRVSAKGPDVATLARVLNDDASGCRRYVARVIQNLKIGPSPRWLADRLLAVGQRPVNNVVDATNYVLLETGQPLHAFDLSKIGADSGVPTIRVRRAESGEKLVTLDGVEHELNDEDLVIADPSRVLALAGVMGGQDSEVTESTTSILLESAYFEPTVVRRTARRHGMHTEASHRFERGVDPNLAARAAERCAQLLADIAEGSVAKGELEVASKAPAKLDISLRIEQIPRLLGVELPAETVVQMLEPLEIRCTARNDAALHFEPPSFRPDLTREIDLIEEVARRFGYENIPARLPGLSGEVKAEPQTDGPRASARQALVGSGCDEWVTFGFGSPRAYAHFEGLRGAPITMLNPLGEEQSALRTTLLPGMFESAGRNQRHGASSIRAFEIGTTFHSRIPEADESERERDLPHEVLRAGVLIYGGRAGGQWFEGGQAVEFADLRGHLESLFEAFDRSTAVTFSSCDTLPHLNPYASAKLSFGGADLGWAGQVHPDLLKAFNVQGPVFAAEIDLDVLTEGKKRRIRHHPLPRFPKSRRDLALLVDQSTDADSLQSFIAQHAGGELGAEVVEGVHVFDVYRGDKIAADKVSLAFAISYRHCDRTLTDSEIGSAFDSLQEKLRAEFALEVR